MTLRIKDASRQDISTIAASLQGTRSLAGRESGVMQPFERAAGKPDADDDTAPLPAEFEMHLSRSYQQITSSVMAVAAVYFAFMAVVQYFIEDAAGFLILGSLSIIKALVCFAVFHEFRHGNLDRKTLELRIGAVAAIIFASLVAHHAVHLQPTRLIYFTFLTLAVTAMGVSLRLWVAAVILPSTAMMMFAAAAGRDVFEQYLFVGIAGAVVSYCMTALTGRAIRREIRARIVADQLRNSAMALADSDVLTGLPNRRHLFRVMKEKLDSGKVVIVGIIDLDGFKPVNDNMGHVIGDKLLYEVGQRLANLDNNTNFVARLGGDEFAIVSEYDCASDSLIEIGRNIRDLLSRPFDLVGTEVSLSASVGLVCDSGTSMTEGELLERADYALYRAKERKSGVEIYTNALDNERRRSGMIDYQLRHCDWDSEFHVVFQPQTDIASGRTVGFEALARWRSPELGPVPPDRFIAAAERTGLIEELTPHLLGKALEAARDWPEHLSLSFNLSPRNIENPATMERIAELLDESGFDPERLEFEVTETMILQDAEHAFAALEQFRRRGVRVALDDFGAGHSNFQKIEQLGFDKVKIDRSFVRRLASGGKTSAVVQAMVGLCRTLGVDCVLEGVETDEELAAAHESGALLVQGYYFAKPMPAVDVAAYLLSEHQLTMNAPPEERRNTA